MADQIKFCHILMSCLDVFDASLYNNNIIA